MWQSSRYAHTCTLVQWSFYKVRTKVWTKAQARFLLQSLIWLVLLSHSIAPVNYFSIKKLHHLNWWTCLSGAKNIVKKVALILLISWKTFILYTASTASLSLGGVALPPLWYPFSLILAEYTWEGFCFFQLNLENLVSLSKVVLTEL